MSGGSGQDISGGASEDYVREVREGCRQAARLAAQIETGEPSTALTKVRQAWIETEMPSRCPDAWSRIWAAVAAAPDASPVMNAREQRLLATLPTRIEAFRGCGAGAERGWSWTLDRSIAEDFSRRYEEDGAGAYEPRLCTAQVDKSAVLAYFDTGEEHEVILDPHRLDWHDVVVQVLPVSESPSRGRNVRALVARLVDALASRAGGTDPARQVEARDKDRRQDRSHRDRFDVHGIKHVLGNPHGIKHVLGNPHLWFIGEEPACRLSPEMTHTNRESAMWNDRTRC